MLSIKKNLGLLAMTAALAACASNPNDLPDFPEHEYAATQQVGEGVINGDLYLTSASGAIQKGTNTKVTLEPATSYMKRLLREVRQPRCRQARSRRATAGARPATRHLRARGDHRPERSLRLRPHPQRHLLHFQRTDLSAQSDGKTITEGGTVTKLVTVSGSQPQKVLLTR